MDQWSAVTWNELEPVLREGLRYLELTEWDYGYGGEQFKVGRRPEEVAKDILNMLESKGYHVVRVQS